MDGSDSNVRQKSSHFQRFGLKIFVISAKAAKTQELGVMDGLLGVVRMGGAKQKITEDNPLIHFAPPPRLLVDFKNSI